MTELLQRVFFETLTDGIGKFVQLKILPEETPIISFGQGYHTEILERILREMGIEFKIKKILADRDIIEPEGERYKAVGMGMYRLDSGILMISRKNSSFDYSLRLDESHFEEIKQHLPKDITEVEFL